MAGTCSNANVKEEEINSEEMMAFCKQTSSYTDGFVRVLPYQTIFPRGYVQYEDQIKDTEILEDDVWISSHPKSGTRWLQELVWLLKNNLNYDTASTVPLNKRQPFFEMAVIDPKNNFGAKECFNWVKMTPAPRIIKSHLSYDMLPKQLQEDKNKLVVIMRNPRDVCCSLYNHYRITDNYTGNFETIVNAFLSDTFPYYGPYFTHVLSYWKRRNELSNLHIVWYEDLQSDFASTVKSLAQFLGVSIGDSDIPELKEYLSFDKIKKNAMVNMDAKIQMIKDKLGSKVEGSMINKGKTGTWKEMMTDEMVKRFEEWEAKGLKDTDLKFKHEV